MSKKEINQRNIDIGKRIREKRIEKKLTMSEMAFLLGWSSWQRVQKLEKGIVNVFALDLYDISQILGVKLVCLTIGEECD